ncbi:M23 family metallopeptidase [Nocardioides pelophilus]|uniref:M23 family metallopeptidase n=1 Tax=Nocardioides pelophilus TaxID=2172019 RepID=UPI0015FFDB27|nr:M23 family metallopeptidase [Nocardioides pelophilus]
MHPLIRLFRALLPAALLVMVAAAPGAGDDDPVGEWPLRPEPDVVALFDPPASPYGPGHRGVDLLGHPGQAVHAALAGTVTFAGSLAGRGVVVVSHGDTRTTYEPVAARVSVGASVAQGAILGSLQAFRSHCAPRACLHWGWLRGETYLDPLRLVGAGPVRLLPLWRDLPFETARHSPPRGPLGRHSPSSLPMPYADWRPLAADP